MRIGLFVVALAACADPDATVEPGPDAPPVVEEDRAEVPAGCMPERATADRPDDSARDQIRVLYVTSADGPDFGHDTSGRICNSVRAFATWFHAQTDSYLRFDTAGGLVDIGFVRLSRTDAELRGDDPGNLTIDTGIAFVRERIERELPLAPNKLYAVYYEGTSSYSCGGGAYPPLIVGRVGAVYLRAMPPGVEAPCGAQAWGTADLAPHYIDYAVLHELVHSLGFAPPAAPHQHASGHVFDPDAPDPQRDLMYSQRVGMPDPYWGTDDPRGLVLDIGGDDYATALSASSLLAPLPAAAQRPIGW
jgi:hypothetical protein